MKKKKISIKDIHVKSFVTSFDFEKNIQVDVHKDIKEATTSCETAGTTIPCGC